MDNKYLLLLLLILFVYPSTGAMTESIAITNPPALTNYQYFLNVTYLPSMANDFSDIHFNQTNGVQCPFWIEQKTNSYFAWVWINIPSASQSSINMLYGDRTGTTSPLIDNNGTSTFVFYDNFDGATLSSAWSGGTLANSVGGGLATFTSAGASLKDKHTSGTYGTDKIFRSRLKGATPLDSTYTYYGFGAYETSTTNSAVVDRYYDALVQKTALYTTKAGGTLSASVTPADANYHITEVKRVSTTSVILDQDGSTKTNVANIPTVDLALQIATYGSSVVTTVDYIVLRNYTATEPTLSMVAASPTTDFGLEFTSYDQTITLSDRTLHVPTSWLWMATNLLGNNTPAQLSTAQNPIVALPAGNWLINLTATNGLGSQSKTRTIGINLSSPQVYFWNRTS